MTYQSLILRTDCNTLKWVCDALDAVKAAEAQLAILQGGVSNLVGERDHWKQRAETAEQSLEKAEQALQAARQTLKAVANAPVLRRSKRKSKE